MTDDWINRSHPRFVRELEVMIIEGVKYKVVNLGMKSSSKICGVLSACRMLLLSSVFNTQNNIVATMLHQLRKNERFVETRDRYAIEESTTHGL